MAERDGVNENTVSFQATADAQQVPDVEVSDDYEGPQPASVGGDESSGDDGAQGRQQHSADDQGEEQQQGVDDLLGILSDAGADNDQEGQDETHEDDNRHSYRPPTPPKNNKRKAPSAPPPDVTKTTGEDPAGMFLDQIADKSKMQDSESIEKNLQPLAESSSEKTKQPQANTGNGSGAGGAPVASNILMSDPGPDKGATASQPGEQNGSLEEQAEHLINECGIDPAILAEQSWCKPQSPFSSVEDERAHYLQRFYRMERNKVIAPRGYNENTPIRKLRAEYKKLTKEQKVQRSVKLGKRFTLAFATLVEIGATRKNVFSIGNSLDGWSESVSDSLMEDEVSWNSIFERMHEKYVKDPEKGSVQPEWELAMALGGSAAMYAINNAAAPGSSAPSAGEYTAPPGAVPSPSPAGAGAAQTQPQQQTADMVGPKNSPVPPALANQVQSFTSQIVSTPKQQQESAVAPSLQTPESSSLAVEDIELDRQAKSEDKQKATAASKKGDSSGGNPPEPPAPPVADTPSAVAQRQTSPSASNAIEPQRNTNGEERQSRGRRDRRRQTGSSSVEF